MSFLYALLGFIFGAFFGMFITVIVAYNKDTYKEENVEQDF